MFKPAANIAPVEQALAAIGVRGIILGNIEKVRAADFSAMSRLPREIETRARAMVRGDGAKLPAVKMDYKPMLKAVTAGIDNERIEQTMASFPTTHRELAMLFSIHATQIASQLSQLIPKSEYQTVTGVIPLAPSDTRIWKFFSVISVLDDPLSVFDRIANGALLKSQASAMRLVYPTLSAAIDSAIQAAVMAEKTDKKSFDVNPRVNYGLRVWMGQGPVSPKMMAYAQDNASDLTKHASLMERAQKKPQAPISPQVKFEATPAQEQQVSSGFGRS